MNTEMVWRADDTGAYSLMPVSTSETGHVWIQGRRPYCDRGHWEWGHMGLPMQAAFAVQPSYYFMHFDTALAAVEDWLIRRNGGGEPSPGRLRVGPCTNAPLDRTLPEWSLTGGGVCTVWQAPDGSAATATIHPVPEGFELSVSGVEADAADLFPRHFARAEWAQKEAEAFLMWRLHRKPAEVPGPVSRPDRRVALPESPPLAPVCREAERPRRKART